MNTTNDSREMLRHTVATLAYRGGKAIRGAPETFGGYSLGAGTRTPLQILGHIGDLLEWALSMARSDQKYQVTETVSWDAEVERLYAALASFDEYLGSDQPLGAPAERLFQGPVADALTHVGQLTLLRRIAEAPVRGENYFVAEIQAGTVGPDQAAPRREFD